MVSILYRLVFNEIITLFERWSHRAPVTGQETVYYHQKLVPLFRPVISEIKSITGDLPDIYYKRDKYKKYPCRDTISVIMFQFLLDKGGYG
jgi:hypothetical protein